MSDPSVKQDESYFITYFSVMMVVLSGLILSFLTLSGISPNTVQPLAGRVGEPHPGRCSKNGN